MSKKRDLLDYIENNKFEDTRAMSHTVFIIDTYPLIRFIEDLMVFEDG